MTSVTALPEDLKHIKNNLKVLDQDLDVVYKSLHNPKRKHINDKQAVKHMGLLIHSVRQTLQKSMKKISLVFSWFPNKVSHRKKRGLFDIVGSGLHYLFGTARNKDIDFLQKKFISLQEARIKHEKIIENMDSKIHHQLNKINELIEMTNKLATDRLILAEITDLLTVMTYVSHVSLHLANDIQITLDHIKNTIDALTMATRNIVTTDLISIDELKGVLNEAAYLYSLKPLFPFSKIFNYFSYLDVQISPSHIIIHIPMSTNNLFQHFSITPFPTPYKDQTIMMDVNDTNILVSQDLEHYVQINNEEMEKCDIGEEITICNTNLSPWKQYTEMYTCQSLLIQSNFDGLKDQSICNFRQVETQFQLQLVQSYSFVYNPERLKMRLTCGNETKLTSSTRIKFHSSCDLSALQFKITGNKMHRINLTKHWNIVEEDLVVLNEILLLNASKIQPLIDNNQTVVFIDSSSTNRVIPSISVASFSLICIFIIGIIVCQCRKRKGNLCIKKQTSQPQHITCHASAHAHITDESHSSIQ